MKYLRLLLKGIGLLLAFFLLLFFIIFLFPFKETVAPISPRANTQYWMMESGFRIAYTHLPHTDSVAKTPVVFLHGGPGGYVHSSIIATLEGLTTDGHSVYLYDQRGSGLSDRLPRYSDINFEKHLEDLHEIVTQHLGVEKVILIGQSFGSNIIAHYAARHPEKIEKIVFSSPGTFLPHRMHAGAYLDLDSLYPAPDSLSFIKPYNFVSDVNRTAMHPKAIVASMGALLFDRKLVSDRQMDRMLNTLASKFTQGMVCDPANVLPEEGGGGLYAYLATNTGDQPEIREDLQRCRAPILVLHGQCEYHSYGSSYEYVDIFPNGQLQFIEGAGHEIWWEQEETYLRAIRNFLAQ